MPTCFQFIDKNEKVMNLNTIDELMCKESGEKYDENNYCTIYMIATLLGMTIAMKHNEVTEEGFDSFMRDNKDSYSERYVRIYRKFLVEDYRFDCWYERY